MNCVISRRASKLSTFCVHLFTMIMESAKSKSKLDNRKNCWRHA